MDSARAPTIGHAADSRDLTWKQYRTTLFLPGILRGDVSDTKRRRGRKKCRFPIVVSHRAMRWVGQNRNQVVPAMSISLIRSWGCFQALSQGLLALREEPVKYIARIKVVSDDRPRRVDARGGGALE
jgi:hypothetical protein